MKNGYVIVAAGALTITAVAFQAVSERRHQAELSGLRSEMKSLSASVSEAQEDLAANKAPSPARTLVIAPEKPAQAAEPDEEEATTAGETEGEPPARAVEVEEMMTELDTVFAEDRADAASAPDATRKASSRVTAVLAPTSGLRSVDCRTSLCRIETTHADFESYRQFVQNAVLNPDTQVWNAGFFSSPPSTNERGELVTTLYIAREGESLPLHLVR